MDVLQSKGTPNGSQTRFKKPKSPERRFSFKESASFAEDSHTGTNNNDTTGDFLYSKLGFIDNLKGIIRR